MKKQKTRRCYHVPFNQMAAALQTPEVNAAIVLFSWLRQLPRLNKVYTIKHRHNLLQRRNQLVRSLVTAGNADHSNRCSKTGQFCTPRVSLWRAELASLNNELKDLRGVK